jgi:hypothetical protein
MPSFVRKRSSAGIHIEGLEALLADLNRCSKETNSELRAKSKQIANVVAADIRGWLGTEQAAPLLTKVRATNDRLPTIMVGGTARAGVSGGATRNQILGANFGSRDHPQFPRPGRPDYYVFQAIKHRSAFIMREWTDAVTEVMAHADPAVRRGT